MTNATKKEIMDLGKDFEHMAMVLKELEDSTLVVEYWADIESEPYNLPISEYLVIQALKFVKEPKFKELSLDAQEEILELIVEFLVNEEAPFNWVEPNHLIEYERRYMDVRRQKSGKPYRHVRLG